MWEVDAAIALIEAGADINVADKDGETYLHIAAGQGQANVVIALLEAEADISARSEEGNTPLHCAVVSCAESDEDQTATAAALIKAGADLYVRNNDGKTALQIAEEARGEKSEMAFLLRVAMEKHEEKARQKAEDLLREE